METTESHIPRKPIKEGIRHQRLIIKDKISSIKDGMFEYPSRGEVESDFNTNLDALHTANAAIKSQNTNYGPYFTTSVSSLFGIDSQSDFKDPTLTLSPFRNLGVKMVQTVDPPKQSVNEPLTEKHQDYSTITPSEYVTVRDNLIEKEDYLFLADEDMVSETLTTVNYETLTEVKRVTGLETSTGAFLEQPTTLLNPEFLDDSKPKKFIEMESTIIASGKAGASTTSIPSNNSSEAYSESVNEVFMTNSTKSVSVSFSTTNIDLNLKRNISETPIIDGNDLNILNERGSPYLTNDFSSSLVLYVGVSFAVALVMFVLTSLWILRRKKYQNKVYLSYELAKPQSHISKPMVPSILPGEISSESGKTDCITPREPLYLTRDVSSMQTVINSKYSGSIESCDSGIDNLAFTDASSNDDHLPLTTNQAHSSNTFAKEKPKLYRYMPSYTKKKKFAKELSARVCSSDGSIFPASPSLSNCLVPPPPYSSSIRNTEKFNLQNQSEMINKISIIKENETLHKDSSLVQ